ncbi:glycosyltransferase family 4 protein [Clavibacter zhangzhiyongii]|uniref:Glycosyltransferase family 4 protein n=2 Tax=Clavibacter zhangzhiyongii TaxID=2768071 RepID=A0A7L7Z441_9MICO|nr:glycosyltransferase family 4 protein [Clavibacter zhangzhiyongii]QOD44467.1 glycosyltransferase family 4 protein [Clavibacter zhangzhiyongii]
MTAYADTERALAQAEDEGADLRGRTILVAHPSAELYGSDRVLLESVAGLVAAGARTVVTLPADGPLVDALTGVGAVVHHAPTPVLRKAMLRPRGFAALVGQSARGLSAGLGLVRRTRPDAVYVNTVTIPLWILVGRLTGRPVLCHVHEAEGSASRAVGTALALPLALATRVVANSRYSVEVLGRALPRVARRAVVVHNGVPGPADPAPARPALEGGLRVLYVGRLSDRKGVDVAVEAIVELRDRGVPATLDIVGAVFPGYEWYEEQLRTTIRVLDLEALVTLHGFHAEVTPYLAAADACVVPSRVDEPFGNTAVEALLAARPVVVSDTSGLREAAGGYESAQLVPPSDPAALADALHLVATDWDAYRARAARDRFRAEHRHGPELYRQRIARSVGTMLSAAKRVGSPRPASSR